MKVQIKFKLANYVLQTKNKGEQTEDLFVIRISNYQKGDVNKNKKKNFFEKVEFRQIRKSISIEKTC